MLRTFLTFLQSKDGRRDARRSLLLFFPTLTTQFQPPCWLEIGFALFSLSDFSGSQPTVWSGGFAAKPLFLSALTPSGSQCCDRAVFS